VGVDYCIGDVLALGVVVACWSGVIEPSIHGMEWIPGVRALHRCKTPAG